MFENYNHLGFNNPYYITDASKLTVEKDFADIIEAFPGKKNLDVVGVIEMLNKFYMLGDRTLVSGLNRTPWMARPDEASKGWISSAVPDHFENDVDEVEIAKELFNRICEEVLGYVGDKKSIGILLSGGMDSRIVAGTVDHLIKTGRLQNVSVCALTWGNENSRDVVYSRQIAEMLNWDWKHYTVTAEDVLNNINVAAERGSEYSGIHLHALPQIRRDIHLDCVLAGSYGDSVGRGEYSGKKVRNLKPIDHNIENSELLKNDVFGKYADDWKEDIRAYHQKFPQKQSYQQNEQDYQLHYMRRMLNPCMEVIAGKTKFYQVFTKPDVFGYMWSLMPERRNDTIYAHLLGFFAPGLSKIPWARTGLPYNATEGQPDGYNKLHHSYRKIVTKEIHTELKNLVLSDEIERLGIFNMGVLKKIVSYLNKYPSISFRAIENIVWLSSLSKTVKMYDIVCEEKFDSNFKDYYTSAVKVPLFHFMEDKYRIMKPVKK